MRFILSGDIQQNDPGTISDNSFHIVTAVKVDLTAVIDGFTIRSGNADSAEEPDYPDIDELLSPEVGAGMLLLGKHTLSSDDACWPLVMRCQFEGNRQEYGAAAFLSANQEADPIFGNCEFLDNIAAVAGAGFYNADEVNGNAQGSMGIFVNCLFAGNSAPTGGAMYCGTYTAVTLKNCTIADNIATAGGGAAGVLHEHAPSTCPYTGRPTTEGWVDMHNCIVYGSDSPQLVGATEARVCWVKELDEICNNITGTPGNIEGNPLFIGGGNYRLQTTPTLSGCIDSGNNALAFASDPGDINQNSSAADMMVELDQRTRIGGVFGATTCAIDRGAYERVTGGCIGDTASPGGNNSVDVDDLISVILHWGACPTPPALCPGDVAGGDGACGDGTVDVDDLIAVILHWGPCHGLTPGDAAQADPESYEDCETLCENLEGDDWIECMQSCFYYLCHEKAMAEFCE